MRNALIVNFLIVCGVIVAFLFFEYYLKLEPCKLCLYQRYAYYAILAFTVYASISRKKRFGVISAAILFAICAGIGLFHFFVEIGFFSYNCQNMVNAETPEELRLALQGVRPSCGASGFKVFGLSLSLLSFIISSAMTGFNIIFYAKRAK